MTAFADSETAVVDPNSIDCERAIEAKRTEGVVSSDDPESTLRGPYDVLIEATVGSAIPVLSTIAGLGPRTISGIHGVRNGTAIVEFESACTVDRTWSCGRPSDVF